MKVFVLVFACFCIGAQALTDEQVDKLKTYNAECSAISKATPDQITKGRQGQFSDEPELKVHILCLSKKLGFQNEAGEIQESVLRNKLASAIGDSAKAEALVKKCLLKKETPELTAFETFKCYKEAAPGVHII